MTSRLLSRARGNAGGILTAIAIETAAEAVEGRIQNLLDRVFSRVEGDNAPAVEEDDDDGPRSALQRVSWLDRRREEAEKERKLRKRLGYILTTIVHEDVALGAVLCERLKRADEGLVPEFEGDDVAALTLAQVIPEKNQNHWFENGKMNVLGMAKLDDDSFWVVMDVLRKNSVLTDLEDALEEVPDRLADGINRFCDWLESRR